MKKPLSKAIKTFYGLGDMGFGLMTAVEMYLFSFFLTDVAKFPLVWVGIIGTVTALVDALLSPFYGAIISGTKPMKWGRNRSWMLIMPPIVIVLYAFSFTKIGGDSLAAIIVILGFVLSHICWNLPWVANVAMIPAMANNPEERALLSGRRAMYSSMASVGYGFIATPLLGLITKITGNEIAAYAIFAALMATLMCIGYWIVFKITDGYEPVEAATADAPKGNRVSIGVMLKSAFQNPPLLALLCGDFFRYMANFIMTAAAMYYFKYVAQNVALMSVYLIVGGLAQVLGATFSPIVAKKLGNRNASILGMVVAGCTLILGNFVGQNIVIFFIIACVFRMMLGTIAATVVAMYSDTSVYGEWKTGQNAAPFVMGLMNLSLKASVTARGIVIPAALAAAGFVATADAATASPAIKQAVMNVFMLYPGICMLVAALIFSLFYKLTRDKLDSMQNEINTRKAAAAE